MAEDKLTGLEERAVRIFSYVGANEELRAGTVRIQHCGARERFKRALTVGGATWALALFCVLLPLVHFVLVPTLLIAGPCIAVYLWNQEAVLLDGKGECPQCKNTFMITRRAVKFPFSEVCEHCQASVRIESI